MSDLGGTRGECGLGLYLIGCLGNFLQIFREQRMKAEIELQVDGPAGLASAAI